MSGCNFRGKPLVIVEETPTELVFQYDGKNYKVDKTPEVINPSSNTWSGCQIGTEWNVEDGKILVTPTEDYNPNNGDYSNPDEYYEGLITPNDVISMPTAKQIFSNEVILNDALGYRIEHEDYDWYDDILDNLTLSDFVEGFWVANGGSQFSFEHQAN